MTKIKVLNLYAGIGGNRKLWADDQVEVTAIEHNEEVAQAYKTFFPNDKVIIADAHKYLLDHYKEYDFIWSSPPCPTHSRIRFMAAMSEDERNSHPSFNPKFPDMKLYEEIIFLKHYFKGKFVVENVIGFYEPLIKPFKVGNHFYWSNFIIPNKNDIEGRCHNGTIEEKQKRKGFDLSKFTFKTIRKDQVLRNCVEPEFGLYIFNCAYKSQQLNFGDLQ